MKTLTMTHINVPVGQTYISMIVPLRNGWKCLCKNRVAKMIHRPINQAVDRPRTVD